MSLQKQITATRIFFILAFINQIADNATQNLCLRQTHHGKKSV